LLGIHPQNYFYSVLIHQFPASKLNAFNLFTQNNYGHFQNWKENPNAYFIKNSAQHIAPHELLPFIWMVVNTLRFQLIFKSPYIYKTQKLGYAPHWRVPIWPVFIINYCTLLVCFAGISGKFIQAVIWIWQDIRL